MLWKGSTSAVEDLTRAPSCGNGVFERICIRFTSEWSSVTATIANLHLASNRFALDGQGKTRALSVSRYGAVTGDRFGLDGQDGLVLSDHHPVWAELGPT